MTLASVGVLFAWDADPALFPARAHDFLAAFPLAMIAFAYLVYQAAHRPARWKLVKAILLAIAFLFWAANQLWPNLRQATLFNDIAIALFVLDVFSGDGGLAGDIAGRVICGDFLCGSRRKQGIFECSDEAA